MAFQGDSIFWVETDKVVPNPFQPRREFDQNKLQELSESIRMYGVLQPLTVTRKEVQREDGTFYTEYELIAGERRLRASRLAQVAQVPVIIREGEQSEQEKLELAIIENLQREDLNAIDRALAFSQLAEQFNLSHTEVAKKVQRSREYVSNSIRLLGLPEHIQGALQRGELGEGHARTLLMLSDKPEEQETIFREILLKKMSVREVERIVRKIATDKVRKIKGSDLDDTLIEIEKQFTETLGTRVQIQKTEFGGKLTIDYFSEEDLSGLLQRMREEAGSRPGPQVQTMAAVAAATPLQAAPTTEPATATSVHSTEFASRVEPSEEVDGEEMPSEQPVTVPDTEPVQAVPPQPTVADEPVQTDTPVAPEPVMTEEPAQSPVHQVQQPNSEQSQADPGLLAKLAAHTSFGFSRPQPSHVPEPAPTTDAQSLHEAVEPPDQEPSEPTQSESTTTTPESTQSEPDVAEPETKPAPDDSDDIYSVRNFSI